MARKRPKQRAAVGVLGKALTRRSRGCCELCGEREEVRLYELPPFPEEPDPDRTVMACGRCRRWLERGGVEVLEARFLSRAVWSPHPPVRLAAARLLLLIDDPEDPWVRDALEAAGIDPERGEPSGG